MSQTANIINGSPNRTPTAPIAVIETDQTNSNTSAPAMNNRWSTSPASSMNSQNSSPPVVNNINHHHNGTNHSINISNFGYINFNYPIGTSNADGGPKDSEKGDGSENNINAIQAKHKASGKREVQSIPVNS
jgi:hypothetical protein